MIEQDYLAWPFFDDSHRTLTREFNAWAADNLRDAAEPTDVDQACRSLVAQLGEGGWLRYAVSKAYGGARDGIDAVSLCLLRENLARRSGLADFAFAMQGLGSGAISLAGSDALKQKSVSYTHLRAHETDSY